jgi:diguanylate cyclase (GGDEF)-like protein
MVASRWLGALTEGSNEVVALCAADGRLRYLGVDRNLVEIIGYGAADFARSAGVDLVHPDERERVRRAFEMVAAKPGARLTIEYRIRHLLGHYVRVQSTAINHLDDDMIHAVVVHTRLLSPSDQAPGSDRGRGEGRGGFGDKVAQAIARAAAERGYGFSVLILELERFKMLAGSYDAAVIDQLVAEVVQRVADLLAPADTLAELGPGEFAILLDGVADRRQAARVAERIQKTVGARFHIGNNSINTSGIVGIATSERRYERAEDVLRDAAVAVGRARSRAGRKRRAVFQTQMRVEDARYMSLVSELHTAVHARQFRLYYQPIVALGPRTLTGFEALIRWEHPRQGTISPELFIPLAEEIGLIGAIGEWVLGEACRQMAAWHREYRLEAPLSISVNLSAKQFADDDLSQQVERALSETGLDARALKLEVTESAILENRDAARGTLDRLKRHGVQVSLDDFGTGYSSFSYLHQLPYDTLKIDRSFVMRIGDSGENTEIIHALIVLAHNLRMDVVAEGVETASQATQLATMWCEYAQGFYFCRPLAAVHAAELIASRPQW